MGDTNESRFVHGRSKNYLIPSAIPYFSALVVPKYEFSPAKQVVPAGNIFWDQLINFISSAGAKEPGEPWTCQVYLWLL